MAKLHKIIPFRHESDIWGFFFSLLLKMIKDTWKMSSQCLISWHKVTGLLYDTVTELFLLFILPFQLINAPQIKNTEHVVLLKR